MKRNKHSLSHYRLLTCDMGLMVPIGCFEVLPGDSIQQGTSLLLRVTPLVAPVMHPVSIRVHHWFVPHRLVWAGWEDFITGVGGTFPSITPTVLENSIYDYMGVKPGLTGMPISPFPVWSYNKIWNEYYRDQDLQAERVQGDATLAPLSWEKDYFTTARPWPQKGGDVSLPLGVSAPVVSTGQPFTLKAFPAGTGALQVASEISGQGIRFGANPTSNVVHTWDNPQLLADLTNATAVNVNDVRRAFALQRYQEARAQYGSRYTEYLAYLGVRSSDARLQRPEYLGGGKATISFSEVLKTGAGEDPAEPVGTLKGHGIAAMRSRRYRRFFEEHGLVLSVLSVRPRAMYADGLNRMWSRTTKEDYWQRELEHIGQQEVFTSELFPVAGNETVIFGYQDRYAEYRHIPSGVSGDFRDILNYWHMARLFSAAPVLNEDFIKCDPGKRFFAEQTQHALWLMVNHRIGARRMVSRSTVGRII